MADSSGLMIGLVLMVGLGAVVLFKGCDLGISAVCGLTGGAAAPPAAAAPPTIEDQFPRQTLTTVMDHLANQATEDIDAGTYRALGRELKLNLKGMLLSHYKSWLEEIAEYNDYRLQPLTGRALAKYSLLIQDAARRMKIRLNPGQEALYRANQFAGTPMLANTTAYARIHVT